MQTVFKNELMQGDSKKEESGQVIITESEGTWIAGWRTIKETWCIGDSLENLLAAFRKGVAEKIRGVLSAYICTKYEFCE